MKIIYRYVTREYLKILAYAIFTFTAVYFIVDFFERFDLFIKYNAPAGVIVRYFLFKLPFIIYQMVPVAVLLSTLLTIGILSKNNEITAMKSGGISITSIALPLILISLAISMLTFMANEYVTPYTNMKARSIKNNVKNKKLGSFLKHDKIWYSGKGLIYNIDYFDAKTNRLHGITIFNLDDEFRLIKRIDADSGEFVNGEWTLGNVNIMEFSYATGTVEIKRFEELDNKQVHIPETPATLKEVRKDTEEMSYNELKRFIAKIKGEGFDASEYEVDMHAKIAIPLVSLIMTIIGIPFALRRQRSGSIAVGVGLSVLIGSGYWITLSFALSLGHAGVLPPFIAAWSSLVIFLLIGAYMFSTIRQ